MGGSSLGRGGVQPYVLIILWTLDRALDQVRLTPAHAKYQPKRAVARNRRTPAPFPT
jgi:hypothetical protein